MTNIELYFGLGLILTFIFNRDLVNAVQDNIEKSKDDIKLLPDGSKVNNDFVFITSYICLVIVWPLTILEIVSKKNK